MSDSFGERAARRRDWTVRIFRLGEEPGDARSAVTTAEERIEMVREAIRVVRRT